MTVKTVKHDADSFILRCSFTAKGTGVLHKFDRIIKQRTSYRFLSFIVNQQIVGVYDIIVFSYNNPNTE